MYQKKALNVRNKFNNNLEKMFSWRVMTVLAHREILYLVLVPGSLALLLDYWYVKCGLERRSATTNQAAQSDKLMS